MRETLKAERSAQSRRRILDAAEEVFAERGFEGAAMKHIAALAGLSVGSIYGHFESKAELYEEALTRRLDDVQRLAAEAAATADHALESLDRGVQAYVTFMLEHPSFLKLHVGAHPAKCVPLVGADAAPDAPSGGTDHGPSWDVTALGRIGVVSQ